MNLPTKLLGSLAVAGMVAVGGTAFTASGVDRTAVTADQIVGVGTVEQTVSNAVLSTVEYVTDGTKVTSVVVTFDDALQAGAEVTLAAYAAGDLVVPAAGDAALTASGTPPEYIFTLASGGLANLGKISVTVS